MTDTSTLPHDEAGFLLGTKVSWLKSVDTFLEIRGELAALRKSFERKAAPSVQAVSTRHADALPPPAEPASALPPANRRKAEIAEPRRSHRIVSTGIGTMRGAAAHAPDIDPAVAVGKEVAGLATSVRDVVQPATRGLGKIFGKENDPKERRRTLWFRRIFAELRGLRGQDKAQHAKEMRLLSEIEKKPVGVGGEGGGGMAGFLGSLLGSVLGPILGMAGALMKFGGGLMKRIPFLGSIMAGGGILSGIMGGDSRQIGSGAGMLGGMFAGAKGGAALGTLLFPGLGTVVGGAVGAAAGAFFGEKAGAILGEWLGKVDWPAIGDKVVGVFEKVGELLGKQWEFTKKVVTAPARAIRWAAEKTNEFVKDKTGVDLGEKARAAGAAVGEKAGAVGSAAMGKVNYAFGGAKGRAAQVGAEYAQGNIGGLDDAHTRALVASTALTESSGGNLRAENKQGYMGRYQAGAQWLRDAGLLKGDPTAAMKKAGFKSEWAWAESGGMSAFLKDDRNWIDGMNREKYLSSAVVQDKAFAVNSTQAYNALLKRGAIRPGMDQAEIAGLLKSRHLGGLNGALAVARGGTGAADANGTTVRKYFDDVATDRHGFKSFYAGNAGLQVPVATNVGSTLRSYNPAPIPTIQAPPPAQAPAIPIPTRQQKIVVEAGKPKSDVGQDVKDRRIAHVATGGMSGSV